MDLSVFMQAVERCQITVVNNQPVRFIEARKTPGHTLAWNGGSWGIRTTILFEPYRALTVIVLTNASNVGYSSAKIAETLLGLARERGNDQGP